MIGIDSVSRLNFKRQFPQTYAILKNRLHAYEMAGYNKVRDNTFINLVPMFLGELHPHWTAITDVYTVISSLWPTPSQN